MYSEAILPEINLTLLLDKVTKIEETLSDTYKKRNRIRKLVRNKCKNTTKNSIVKNTKKVIKKINKNMISEEI